MGSKRKIIVALALLLSICIVIICVITHMAQTDYNAKLIETLNKQDTVSSQEIFSFAFDRAYVFDDCYISGEGFAERHILKISINNVQAGVSENIQRIVFVDESGNFVYEFKCDCNEVLFLEKGMIIYPETIIEKTSSAQEGTLTIRFQSSEHY